MKYLVLSKFRLTDQGLYLDANTIFEPDRLYEQSSRSFMAAKRSGWLKQLTDEEAAKIEEQNIVKQVPMQAAPPVDSKVQSLVRAPVGVGKELRAEDIADEVVGSNIVEARDRRREQASERVAQAKRVVSESRNANEETDTATAAVKRPIDQGGGEKVKINKTKAHGVSSVPEVPEVLNEAPVDVAADIKSKMDQKIRRKKMGKIRFEKA